MLNEKVFEKIGLTTGETKVYSSLLSLGQCTIGPIVSESKVSKSKIYDILDRLISKGFVGYSTKNNVKYFFVNDPHTIIDYLDKKEKEINKDKKEIEKILPSLISKRKEFIGDRIAEIYQGFNGMKTIREELMKTFKSGDNLLVLGAPKIANEKWEGWLLDFHRRRISRKIGMKIIYNYDARNFGEIRTKMKLTEVKYMPNELSSPNWIDVFPEAVLFVVLADKNPIAFLVRDKSRAENFRAYFDLMWKLAKK